MYNVGAGATAVAGGTTALAFTGFGGLTLTLVAMGLLISGLLLLGASRFRRTGRTQG